ncbi:MAG: hypothetical protein ABSG68_11405 [Thermoguttaceae bacterium]|jgi:hypothetical protein
MPSIDGNYCSYLHGTIPAAAAEAIERWHRPGVDGDGLAVLGQSGVECQLTAVLYANSDAINGWAAALLACQGTFCNVTNDFGDTATLFIQQVLPPAKKAAYAPGTLINCRGEVTVRAIRIS